MTERARLTDVLAFLACTSKGESKALSLPPSGPTLTKFTAEYMERRSPAWKPSTRNSIKSYHRQRDPACARPSSRRRNRVRRCGPLFP